MSKQDPVHEAFWHVLPDRIKVIGEVNRGLSSVVRVHSTHDAEQARRWRASLEAGKLPA